MALDSLLSETATRLHRISDGGGTLSRWPSASLAVGISCPRSAPPRASSPPPAERRRRRRQSGPRGGRRPVGRARRGAAVRRRPTPQPPAGYPRLRRFEAGVCVGDAVNVAQHQRETSPPGFESPRRHGYLRVHWQDRLLSACPGRPKGQARPHP
jgi:hypothetical protein